jgi:glycosyltransferase involved in cell wall biosynthesis
LEVTAKSKISIAMAVRNGERFIREQLDSFAYQLRLPDEVVVSDNASSDRTLEIVRRFAKSAPFEVRLIVNARNLGIGRNFGSALSRCTGDIICLCDSDDLWCRDKLYKVETVFEGDSEAALVLSDADLVSERLEPLNYTLWQSLGFPLSEAPRFKKQTKLIRYRSLFYGNTMAFRSSYLAAILPIPDVQVFLSGAHDWWIGLLVLCLQGRVALIHEPLIRYRQHDGQQGGIRLNVPWRKRLAALSPIDRVSYPTLHFYRLLLRRIRGLHCAVDEEFIGELVSTIGHYTARACLPDSRIRRLLPVCVELASLRYHRFAEGLISATGDLLRPARISRLKHHEDSRRRAILRVARLSPESGTGINDQ